ncbi:hypothetical protein YSY43_34520 [Paenibacillus sp. YSY-4.3]
MRTLNGINVSNYALNECFKKTDGFYALKIKNPGHDWDLPFY